jgi:ElaB/YqjD/DUF883 family membrane-anchored ribosome-binding protein
MSAREELEKLIAEIAALRDSAAREQLIEKAGWVSKDLGFEAKLGDLRQAVSKMLNETEAKVSGHPLPTVAGALALGILIGWVSSHPGKRA